MDSHRREFLKTISRVAAVTASRSVFIPERKADRWETSADRETRGDMGTDNLREQFPQLTEVVDGRMLAYLDSAATTQRPRAVLAALEHFYTHENANPAMNLHSLARRSAVEYDKAREKVAKFINATGPEEIVFTRGTTEAINLVASSWGSATLRPGDEILLTVADHYSNLVPWQLAAKRADAALHVLDVGEDGHLRLDQLDAQLSKRTRIVTFPHVSNVLGAINPAKEICDRARRAGAVVLVDAAQSVPHFRVDVQEIGCDFLAFSGHKMCGPMGIGVLWARRDLLERMPPFQAGSNMTHDVEIDSVPAHFAKGALKFEAGTPNVSGAVGLAAAIAFLESLDRKTLWAQEQKLTQYALAGLQKIKGLRILGPTEANQRISVFSFFVDNREPLEIARALDAQGIAVRAGDLASLPLLKKMGLARAVRASCYVYTSTQEIDRLVVGLQTSNS